MKSLRIAVMVVLAVGFGLAAKADHMENVNLTFQSGATFSGVVDFSNDWSQLTGVNGVLNGYQYGTFRYAGSGSDVIDWIWLPGSNFASGTNMFGSFLMDGPPNDYSAYSNWIAFTYDYTNAPGLVLLPNTSSGVEVDYNDPLLSGSISSNVTPEPTSLLLLGSGLVGLAGMIRRKLAA